ncbi:MAG TPA: class I SAM-dependent methyltransferase [Acetobacteraceae bacterium]|nr:class I SAM-dependent methyltransferase [Acetobacteraceae bacterium]
MPPQQDHTVPEIAPGGVARAADLFQCPACRGALVESGPGLVCGRCAAGYQRIDGILDFVRGRFDTQLDPHQYDAEHGISDASSAGDLRAIRALLGHRWPESLGRMVEIGCGTGGFSRAVLATGAVREAVLSDVSLDMLRICQGHLERLDLANRVPVTLATYSTAEPCFRDASFDCCIGAQVLHHVPDYAAFLHDLFRFLKPGGIAFFTEPALPFHRALACGLADLLAEQMAADPAPSHDRQVLHNWIAIQRRDLLHQGDLAYLATLEDKHMFVPGDFVAMARRIGFAAVEALPLAPDPSGTVMAAGLCFRIGVTPEGTAALVRALPRHTQRHFARLAAKDRTASYLFWLRKPDFRRGSAARHNAAPAVPQRAVVDLSNARWFLEFQPEPDARGLALRLWGWCLLNSDVKWLRVCIGGVQRQVPVWYPRADVHAAFNQDGAYAAWNSLCCGVSERLVFDGIAAEAEALPISVQLELINGYMINLPVHAFRPNQPLLLER